MADLQTYISTFNCGRAKIDIDFFAAHLFDGLKSATLPPDIIVLCLQEVAPIAYTFLSASLMAPYIDRFQASVATAVKAKFGTDISEEYAQTIVQHVGMTAIMVFTRKEVQEQIRGIDTAGVGVGLWEMGNKGAVGVRLWLQRPEDDGESVPLTFVSAHLAPMESHWQRRNEDWKSICQRLVFTPNANLGSSRTLQGLESEPLLSQEASLPTSGGGEQGLLSPTSFLFFAGDLNYRTADLQPHPDDHVRWPKPHSSSWSEEDFSAMLEQDQLSRERNAGRTLHLMSEAPIAFPPTYKYSSYAQQDAVALAAGESGSNTDGSSIWASHRIPSWCDRILFLAAASPKTESYVALPVQPTSDHRPVVLLASVSPNKLNTTENVKSPFSIDKEWKSKRAVARRLELAVGVGAYLTLTYDGNALLAGTIVGIVGGAFILRALLGT